MTDWKKRFDEEHERIKKIRYGLRGSMRSKFGALGGTLLAVMIGLACATPLDVEPIPLSANPSHQITQLALDLSAARGREIGLLAPSWFARAEAAYHQARERRREGGDLADILEAVVEGSAALDKSGGFLGRRSHDPREALVCAYAGTRGRRGTVWRVVRGG